MKTDRTDATQEAARVADAKDRFEQELKRQSTERRPPERVQKPGASANSAKSPGARSQLAKSPVAKRTALQVLNPHERVSVSVRTREVRARLDANVETLVARRTDHDGRTHRSLEERVLDRVAVELEAERPGNTHGPVESNARPAPASTPTTKDGVQGVALSTERNAASRTVEVPRTSAEAAVELVQKIEIWVKSSRPTLSLTVGGALASEVTVERTGRGRISLSLRGTHGPPSKDDVRAVREALEARGLQVSALRIA